MLKFLLTVNQTEENLSETIKSNLKSLSLLFYDKIKWNLTTFFICSNFRVDVQCFIYFGNQKLESVKWASFFSRCLVSPTSIERCMVTFCFIYFWCNNSVSSRDHYSLILSYLALLNAPLADSSVRAETQPYQHLKNCNCLFYSLNFGEIPYKVNPHRKMPARD